jgi:hypothetical protein
MTRIAFMIEVFTRNSPYGDTVRVMELLVMLPDIAVTAVVSVPPTVCAVAKPELSMVAAVVFEQFHVTESVRSTVFPFWRRPVAVNCAVPPEEIDWLVAVMVIEDRFAVVTVAVVEPVTPSNVPLIVAVPAATPVTNPVELTVAMVLSDVDQLTEFVTVSVTPFSNVPVATICCELPIATDGVEGVTVMLVKEGGMKKFLHPTTMKMPSTSVSPQKAAARRRDLFTFRCIAIAPLR